MRDDDYPTKSVIMNLHPTRGTHWVACVNENHFDFHGCPLTKINFSYRKSGHEK